MTTVTRKEAAVREEDQRLILSPVSWETYERLRELLDDHPGLRMFYLEGTLEIMCPSRNHESIKKTAARLVEIYAFLLDLPLCGYGSTTFKARAKERGLEPDECYSMGVMGEVPDFAIEVQWSSGGIDKLAIYAGLGVPEVWFWEDGSFQVYSIEEGAYGKAERSRFLPDLDLALLATYSSWEDQAAAVKAFAAVIRP